MAEYIDRQALQAALAEHCATLGTYEQFILDSAGEIIYNFPAADVRKNVKGVWELTGSGDARCSRCGHITSERLVTWDVIHGDELAIGDIVMEVGTPIITASKPFFCSACGAPIDYEQIKCPYCGTYYFDLSEMTVGEVAMLKVNIPNRGKVFARALLTDFDVTAKFEEMPVYNEGDVLVQYHYPPSVTADMHFDFVEGKDGSMFTVIKEDGANEH